MGATYKNTYVWDGKELKPKVGATYKNTFVWTKNEIKPKSGATKDNTWKTDGNIPVPVAAVIVLGLYP